MAIQGAHRKQQEPQLSKAERKEKRVNAATARMLERLEKIAAQAGSDSPAKGIGKKGAQKDLAALMNDPEIQAALQETTGVGVHAANANGKPGKGGQVVGVGKTPGNVDKLPSIEGMMDDKASKSGRWGIKELWQAAKSGDVEALKLLVSVLQKKSAKAEQEKQLEEVAKQNAKQQDNSSMIVSIVMMIISVILTCFGLAVVAMLLMMIVTVAMKAAQGGFEGGGAAGAGMAAGLAAGLIPGVGPALQTAISTLVTTIVEQSIKASRGEDIDTAALAGAVAGCVVAGAGAALSSGASAATQSANVAKESAKAASTAAEAATAAADASKAAGDAAATTAEISRLADLSTKAAAEAETFSAQAADFATKADSAALEAAKEGIDAAKKAELLAQVEDLTAKAEEASLRAQEAMKKALEYSFDAQIKAGGLGAIQGYIGNASQAIQSSSVGQFNKWAGQNGMFQNGGTTERIAGLASKAASTGAKWMDDNKDNDETTLQEKLQTAASVSGSLADVNIETANGLNSPMLQTTVKSVTDKIAQLNAMGGRTALIVASKGTSIGSFIAYNSDLQKRQREERETYRLANNRSHDDRIAANMFGIGSQALSLAPTATGYVGGYFSGGNEKKPESLTEGSTKDAAGATGVDGTSLMAGTETGAGAGGNSNSKQQDQGKGLATAVAIANIISSASQVAQLAMSRKADLAYGDWVYGNNKDNYFYGKEAPEGVLDPIISHESVQELDGTLNGYRNTGDSQKSHDGFFDQLVSLGSSDGNGSKSGSGSGNSGNNGNADSGAGDGNMGGTPADVEKSEQKEKQRTAAVKRERERIKEVQLAGISKLDSFSRIEREQEVRETEYQERVEEEKQRAVAFGPLNRTFRG